MKIAYKTDIGQKRKNNQDYIGVYENQAQLTLAIVADGMGGHLGGDIASEMAVSHIGHHFIKTDEANLDQSASWLVAQLKLENQHILEKSHQYRDLEGMGTTIVALLADQTHYYVVHIGDSRAYRLSQGHFKQLTEDHSLVNELVKKGELSPTEAQNYPQKNVITQALGVFESLEIEVTKQPIQVSTYLLLCSDGLTNMLSDQSIEEVIQNSALTLQEKCDQLIVLANQAGGNDNISALLLYFDKSEVN